MNRTALSLVLALGLCGPVLAQGLPNDAAHDQQALAQARAAHVAALRAHDPAAIAATEQRVRAASESIYNSRVLAAEAAAGPAKGETRAAQMELLRAADAYQDAVESGDRAEIARTHAALRRAHQDDWMVRHHRPVARN